MKVEKLKYDWSKTAEYALIHWERQGKYLTKRELGDCSGLEIADCWLPHFGGPCPFDEKACRVEVKFRNGARARGAAGCFYWPHRRTGGDIIACRFVKLIDNAEF